MRTVLDRLKKLEFFNFLIDCFRQNYVKNSKELNSPLDPSQIPKSIITVYVITN